MTALVCMESLYFNHTVCLLVLLEQQTVNYSLFLRRVNCILTTMLRKSDVCFWIQAAACQILKKYLFKCMESHFWSRIIKGFSLRYVNFKTSTSYGMPLCFLFPSALARWLWLLALDAAIALQHQLFHPVFCDVHIFVFDFGQRGP